MLSSAVVYFVSQARTGSDRMPSSSTISSDPDVLVVIPTLNEADAIERVLRQLYSGLDATPGVRFVVADGGSSDGTAEIVKRLSKELPSLELMNNPKRRQGSAINLAVRNRGAGARYLVRCDAHASYPPAYIARLLATLEQTGADSIVVPMDSVGQACLGKAIAGLSDTPIGSGGSAHRGGRRSGYVDHGHHAIFSLSKFAEAGGYDETFTHNEDAEFDCRFGALGGRIFLDADIRIEYEPRSTFSGLARQYFNYGRGRSRTVRRHPGSMRMRQFAVPFHMLLCIAALLLSPVTIVPLLWPALYVAALALFSITLSIRKRSICGLLAGPAAFLMHSAWAFGFAWGLVSVREAVWKAEQPRPDLSASMP
jgi:succinoglycan biosynthesis protein ExoA